MQCCLFRRTAEILNRQGKNFKWPTMYFIVLSMFKAVLILDRMDEKIGGLESKYIFNRKQSENANSVSELNSDTKEDSKNTIACTDKLPHLTQNLLDKSKILKKEDSISRAVVDTDVKRASPARGLKNSLGESLPGVNAATGAGTGLSDVAATSAENGKTTRCKDDSDKGETKVSKVPVNQVEVKDKTKSAKDSDASENKLSKKAGPENSIKLSMDKKMKCEENVKGLVGAGTSEENLNSKRGNNSLGPDQGIKSEKDSGNLESRPLKKARVDSSLKLLEDKNKKSVQKLTANRNGNNGKDLTAAVTASEAKPKPRLALDSLEMKTVPKKEQPDERIRKPSNGKMLKIFAPGSADDDKEIAHQEFEVTGKPDVDKSKWFKQLPWEERVKSAYEQGTIILLRNLDPECTSGEVEGIIWHTFKETCTAKMVQHTAISNPHSGQALVIFKTKEVAERVIRKLDTGCLMLSNCRPLVASTCPPLTLSGKQSTLFGHLAIDKIKLQIQRETKDAVSTSHCSQPNTIEFEMAMEWCLLQSKSAIWWKKLYKQQAEELKKLEANLKRK